MKTSLTACLSNWKSKPLPPCNYQSPLAGSITCRSPPWVRVGLCLPPKRLSICFLHKINKSYFEILVHSGVASQRRKAVMYFKKWKWFGGRRHISSWVPSLRLENRSGAWGGGVDKGRWGEERHMCLWLPHAWREVLKGRLTLSRWRVRKGTEVLTLGTTSLAPSYHVFSILGYLCTELCSDLGKSLPSGSLGESQEGNMQFIQFAFGLDCRIYLLTLMKHYCPRILWWMQH